MKKLAYWIKGKYINLPRCFRVWWGKQFVCMLGKMGTNEFYEDIVLYNALSEWIKNQKK